MRSNSILLILLGAVLAVSSKFLIRWNNKHIFNPTNFAIVAMMLATDKVWVSPGQWGSAAFFGFLIACAGMVVVYRSSRSDVTVAFLVFWTAILVGRSLILGDPLTIPLHRLENGALLLAFFMISDPRTTPHSRTAGILFARSSPPAPGTTVQAVPHERAAVVSLFASPLVSFIDRLIRAPRFEWRAPEFPCDDLPFRSLPPVLHRAPFKPSAALRGQGDAKLFQSELRGVVLVRDGDRTVMTMANDFKGDPNEFAVVNSGADGAPRGQTASPTRRSSILSTPIRRHAWSSITIPSMSNVVYERNMYRAPMTRRPRVVGAKEPRRHDRGALHGRRVRHPDPLRD